MHMKAYKCIPHASFNNVIDLYGWASKPGCKRLLSYPAITTSGFFGETKDVSLTTRSRRNTIVFLALQTPSPVVWFQRVLKIESLITPVYFLKLLLFFSYRQPSKSSSHLDFRIPCRSLFSPRPYFHVTPLTQLYPTSFAFRIKRLFYSLSESLYQRV